ncbi:hypothetical protein B0H10DRAFT_2049581 [Mycena sp. CBHHK59/15]|nr:hypothetical protein B0H10DRAFT_2052051 [Mycena sp. CBHHK59/15]KAJ6613124.1 hypothetical protein B0H10DRAFT_2049581 [Mycena sp. CBHHK59/15]
MGRHAAGLPVLLAHRQVRASCYRTSHFVSHRAVGSLPPSTPLSPTLILVEPTLVPRAHFHFYTHVDAHAANMQLVVAGTLLRARARWPVCAEGGAIAHVGRRCFECVCGSSQPLILIEPTLVPRAHFYAHLDAHAANMQFVVAATLLRVCARCRGTCRTQTLRVRVCCGCNRGTLSSRPGSRRKWSGQ